ncbi:MAG TPA: glycosyltransferase family 2 protein [Polyangia bacterium]|nr:glycosyltransferase family 2 protein [Polyangia bacterium]
MDVSVILCTYNRAALLRRVLEQLVGQSTAAELAWEVLVVDNNSKDDTGAVAEEFVRRFPGRFRAARETRQGKSWALNSALDLAAGKILAFTDDDVELDSRWLQELVRPFSDPACMGVGGRIVPLFNQGQPRWLSGALSAELRAPLVAFDLGDAPLPLKLAPYGANMAFRREMFQRHGRFRTDIGPSGNNVVKGEDVELAQRMLDAGEPFVYAPAALVRHPVEPMRQRRQYFLRWWFEYGRTEAKVEDGGAAVATVFGVPRYLLPLVCGAAARALLSRDEKDRLSHAARAARFCGCAAAARERRASRPSA